MDLQTVFRRFLLVVPAAWLATAGLAVDARAAGAVCAPVVEDGWIRQPPAPRPMLAGFGRIVNRCDAAVAVVAVRSPVFGEVSLHETRVVDGISRMREVERLPVAARGEATLQPGGLHLMLMQPQAGLSEGTRVPLFLRLDDGREVEAALVVRSTAPVAADRAHTH